MASISSALMAPAQVRPQLIATVKGRHVFRSGHACKGEQDTTRPLFVNSSQPAPANLLTSGSQVFVDTDLPLNAGQWRGGSLRVALNGSGTPSAGQELARVAPTTLWASYFEIYFGSQLIETVYNPISHQETWEWAGDQDRNNLIPLIAPGGLSSVDVSGVAVPVGQGWQVTAAAQVVFIPLRNVLDSIRPYCRGIAETIKIRTYFNGNSVFAPYNPANTVLPLTVSEVKLVMLEAILSEDADRALAQAYNSSMTLPCIIRERFQDTITVSAGNDTNTVLRSLKNKSAGIVFFVQDTANVSSSPVQSQNLGYYIAQMLDARNNKLSERLDESYINSVVIPHNIYSAYNAEQNTLGNTTYGNAGLFPFAKGFQRTVHTGCFSGQFQFSSLETLVINPGTSVPGAMTNTKSLSVFSFSYGVLMVNGRKSSFRYL